ncbi:MAG: Phospho-N-acetylmuramoyl-pentapeptide-transferase [Ignavibacteria bacterium]|nr:Phospho-N-acetylmuramoyl-pentapeptide-transferase [Ignavibacteria bacterium]
MFYYLTHWIRAELNTPGFGVFQYITFRAAAAAISAVLLAFLLGPYLIELLRTKQIGESAKAELAGVGNHSSKAGTPTMGGLIVLFAILIPTIFWADIANAYIILIIIATVWLGIVGFIDDYLKVIKKKPNGLIGNYKLVGQISIGLIVGCTIYFYPEWFSPTFIQIKTLSTVPFVKNLSIDFGLLYIPLIVFIITATSNAVNLTDGLDGLAIGTVGITALALAVISYVSGNVKFAEYLNIPHLSGSGELTVFCAALVGASLGFLWFNSYPAQIIMGDTGALALGGSIGVLCILLKKELLLPILGGIFFMETVSVIIQMWYFKYTRKRYGEGRRIFKMAPVHHHFEKLGWHESKIVSRFYIIAIILAIIALATFKVR